MWLAWPYRGDAQRFDQGGNVWEWNEAIIASSNRALRGGEFKSYPEHLAASVQNARNTTEEHGLSDTGFRVAMIPEPSTALLLATGLAGLAAARRRS